MELVGPNEFATRWLHIHQLQGALHVKIPGLRYGLKLGVWTHNPRIDEDDHEAVAEVLLDAMNVSKKGGVKDGTWTFEEERKVGESLL